MIFTFRFISNEEESFILDVNINHDQTFEELHKAIQQILKYDESQMASFFKSNNSWEKLEEITLMEMGTDEPKHTMSATRVEDLFTKAGENILYVFDFFNERLFFGSIVRMIDAEPPIKLPSVSKLEGKIPQQIATTGSAEEDLMANFDEMLRQSGLDDDDDLPEELYDDMENF